MTKRYGSQIVKASVNKIVQIGTGPSYLKYTVSKNDTMYVTSSDLPVRNLPDANAEKILTLKKDDEVKVLEIEKDWYKIEYTICQESRRRPSVKNQEEMASPFSI